MKKIFFVFGTRPEAIKMAPAVKELKTHKKNFMVKVCVSAQHREMLDQVLEIFNIKPDYDLNLMKKGQSLEHITSKCLLGFTEIFKKDRPDLILVHGDTTTSFAAALSAFYQRIPVGHVEAGLRSFDLNNPYPEEANRLLTDRLCDLFFAPTYLSKQNLLTEGIPKDKIYITGNTVIDALFMAIKKKRSFENPELKKFFNNKQNTHNARLVLVTAHRRENFGKPLEDIFLALKEIADKYEDVKIIYPVHMNPNVLIAANRILSNHKKIHLIPPVNYLDLINLMKMSYLIITDSGGIQEEAPALGKPVLVLRKVTERPEGVKAGTVKIVGTNRQKIFNSIKELLENNKAYNAMAKARNPYGDGKAGARIAQAIKYYFSLSNTKPIDYH
ncbi:MAG: UDP-N-acetylglucosamine 2-epimerase (non-hydrolyzing) [Elusimicrobia bacterium]|nr:UDP-N-acetylglucosamine 2-epimerase (non-hydrolyzing) [Elusimicrobiota bacterium]MBU2614306.1 UDP-N-acetylglucosamine 2-epimerase (non-hydrolyzing) [Elusimicrobiota bacterium]